MAAIFDEKNFFFYILDFLDTLWVKNFDEIAPSRTIKELPNILRFAIFAKNSKIHNGRHFGWEIFFLIFRISRYPVGQKFRRNCSFSHH